MQSTVTPLAILSALLVAAPLEYLADIRSTIETLKGFEIIFAEGLGDAETHASLFDSIEDARELINDIEWDLRFVDYGMLPRMA